MADSNRYHADGLCAYLVLLDVEPHLSTYPLTASMSVRFLAARYADRCSLRDIQDRRCALPEGMSPTRHCVVPLMEKMGQGSPRILAALPARGGQQPRRPKWLWSGHPFYFKA